MASQKFWRFAFRPPLDLACGGVAETSSQETLQNRTNEQNGGRMGRAQSMSGIWTILCDPALSEVNNM